MRESVLLEVMQFRRNNLVEGGVQAVDADGNLLSAVDHRPVLPPPPCSLPPPIAVSPPSVIADEDLLVEYMEMCPEEEFAANGGAANYPPFAGLQSTPVHPWLIFQHPKLMAIFEKYSTTQHAPGLSARKMSSTKWAMACLACKILAPVPERPALAALPATTVSAYSPTAAASPSPAPSLSASPSLSSKNFLGSGLSANSGMPRPLPFWPARPDLDRCFTNHTKFAEGVADCTGAGIGSGIGGGGVTNGTGVLTALDYAGFCDAIFHIVEVKYKPVIIPPGSTVIASVNIATALANGAMTTKQAFLHFVDSLTMPEETPASQSSTSAASISPTTSPGALVGRRISNPNRTQSMSHTLTPVHAHPSLSHSSSDLHVAPSFLARTAPSSPAPSHARLAEQLSQLLAPKDSSVSVFTRLQGLAQVQSSSLKKRRKEKEAQAGTLESFLAAHQAGKHKTKSKTNKK
jgi:hypothetical protein